MSTQEHGLAADQEVRIKLLLLFPKNVEVGKQQIKIKISSLWIHFAFGERQQLVGPVFSVRGPQGAHVSMATPLVTLDAGPSWLARAGGQESCPQRPPTLSLSWPLLPKANYWLVG